MLPEQAIGRGSICHILIAPVWPNQPSSPVDYQLPSPTATTPRCCHQPGGASSSLSTAGPTRTLSCLACVGRSCCKKGRSTGVFLSSEDHGEIQQSQPYSSAWHQWDSHAVSWEESQWTLAPLSLILDFLLRSSRQGSTITQSILFAQQSQWPTVKLMVSMMADIWWFVALWRVCSTAILQCQDVYTRLGCECFFSYFWSLSENTALSFQVLTHKLAMLMAVANADRCSCRTSSTQPPFSFIQGWWSEIHNPMSDEIKNCPSHWGILSRIFISCQAIPCSNTTFCYKQQSVDL